MRCLCSTRRICERAAFASVLHAQSQRVSLFPSRQATCTVRARRSCAAEALRVFMARSCCAGAKVGTTVAAPSGLGSSSVCVPFLDTRMHRSTCNCKTILSEGRLHCVCHSGS